jgi:hypothetical protein
MLDNSSPETRAGMSYQRGLSQSLGLGPAPMRVATPSLRTQPRRVSNQGSKSVRKK